MLLLVGLGNPGKQYACNRHNIGFMAIDKIMEQNCFAPPKHRFQGLVSEGKFGRRKCIALKPQTFMNESGRSVGEAARFYKIHPNQITVFHDELDLAPGKVRIKMGGGLAGHNGLKSLASQIGKDFRRVRIGVGHPGHKDGVLKHVLQNFRKTDESWVGPLLDAVAESAALLTSEDSGKFASKVALILNLHKNVSTENNSALTT